jgi:hypothetical protein
MGLVRSSLRGFFEGATVASWIMLLVLSFIGITITESFYIWTIMNTVGLFYVKE